MPGKRKASAKLSNKSSKKPVPDEEVSEYGGVNLVDTEEDIASFGSNFDPNTFQAAVFEDRRKPGESSIAV